MREDASDLSIGAMIARGNDAIALRIEAACAEIGRLRADNEAMEHICSDRRSLSDGLDSARRTIQGLLALRDNLRAERDTLREKIETAVREMVAAQMALGCAREERDTLRALADEVIEIASCIALGSVPHEEKVEAVARLIEIVEERKPDATLGDK